MMNAASFHLTVLALLATNAQKI